MFLSSFLLLFSYCCCCWRFNSSSFSFFSFPHFMFSLLHFCLCYILFFYSYLCHCFPLCSEIAATIVPNFVFVQLPGSSCQKVVTNTSRIKVRCARACDRVPSCLRFIATCIDPDPDPDPDHDPVAACQCFVCSTADETAGSPTAQGVPGWCGVLLTRVRSKWTARSGWIG